MQTNQTYADKLLELLPNTPLSCNRVPDFCPRDIGWEDMQTCGTVDGNCAECWRQPYKEDKPCKK